MENNIENIPEEVVEESVVPVKKPRARKKAVKKGDESTTRVEQPKAEESNGGLMAVVISIVALVLIASSVGAFYLFVKLKKNYFEPMFNARIQNQTPGTQILPEDTNTPPAEVLPVGIGDTSPIPPMPVEPTDPTVPSPTIPTTPEPDLPNIPEPKKVGSYDFDGAISGMDSTMNTTTDVSFSNSLYSNDYFGF